MALIKLRNLAQSQIEDYTGRNLIAVALNDENLASETRTFDCGTLISGMMLEFSGDANFANFENGLQVSGEQVATGKVDLPQLGGQQILSEGNDGSVLFGGSDGSDKKDLSFLHGGEEKMGITEVGVDIKPALTVNGQNVMVVGDNISLLDNNANYITSDDVPTNISAFTNDSEYLTSTSLPGVISVGALTLMNGTENLGTFTSNVSSTIDINVEKYNETEVALMN